MHTQYTASAVAQQHHLSEIFSVLTSGPVAMRLLNT